MPIPDPLRCPVYESGGLIQQCDACRWAQRGHKRELAECPECGAALGTPLAISFGGMDVVYGGTNFDIYTSNGAFVSLQRSDLPEIAQFLCRHGEDLRSGNLIHDAGPLRRIAWQQPFEKHLRGRR